MFETPQDSMQHACSIRYTEIMIEHYARLNNANLKPVQN